jgi:hypothetical protein
VSIYKRHIGFFGKAAGSGEAAETGAQNDNRRSLHICSLCEK